MEHVPMLPLSNLSPENEGHRALRRIRSPQHILWHPSAGPYHNVERATRKSKSERQVATLLKNSPMSYAYERGRVRAIRADGVIRTETQAYGSYSKMTSVAPTTVPTKMRKPIPKWRLKNRYAIDGTQAHAASVSERSGISCARALDVANGRAVPPMIARKVARAFGAEVPTMFMEVR